jgi:hypothetical protein
MGSLKWLEGAFDHRSRVLITACFTWDDDPGLSTVQNFSARRTTQRLCALDTLIKGQRTNLRLRQPQSVDQLACAPGCFSGFALAKASIIESELAIRVKFDVAPG